MFEVNIGKAVHSVEVADGNLKVDGKIWEWDLIQIEDRVFHISRNSRSYLVELIELNPVEKLLVLKVNGIQFEAVVKDRYDLLLEKLGMNHGPQSDHLEVKAPMPGKILDVLVSEGQAVKKGDRLLVLEAMKMENMIKANSDGTIESIFVDKGMNVEKNQVLIQF